MKKWHLSLLLVTTFATFQFVGCGSENRVPTPEEQAKVEAEIVKGESAL